MQFLIPAYLLVPGMTLCFEPGYFNYVIEETVLDYIAVSWHPPAC